MISSPRAAPPRAPSSCCARWARRCSPPASSSTCPNSAVPTSCASSTYPSAPSFPSKGISACSGEVVTGSPSRTCATQESCSGEVATGSPSRTCATQESCSGEVVTGSLSTTCLTWSSFWPALQESGADERQDELIALVGAGVTEGDQPPAGPRIRHPDGDDFAGVGDRVAGMNR